MCVLGVEIGAKFFSRRFNEDLEARSNQLLSSDLLPGALCFAMVLCASLNFIEADTSSFLLNRRDIVLLIHSYPSPSMNRMWADRKKSNYFSTGAQSEQNSFGALVL